MKLVAHRIALRIGNTMAPVHPEVRRISAGGDDVIMREKKIFESRHAEEELVIDPGHTVVTDIFFPRHKISPWPRDSVTLSIILENVDAGMPSHTLV